VPPGGNIETARTEFAPIVIERLRRTSRARRARIKYYNFSAWDGFGGTAVVYPPIPATSRRPCSCRDEIMVGFPDTPVFVQRGSLLSVDGNNAREIRLYLGADLSR
jgi:hypothetical protein